LEPVARRLALVTPAEKRDARARQAATVPPLQAARTVVDAQPIPVAASNHSHSARPDPARGAIAPASARHTPPPNRTEPAPRKPGLRGNNGHSGESVRAQVRVRRWPIPLRPAQ